MSISLSNATALHPRKSSDANPGPEAEGHIGTLPNLGRTCAKLRPTIAQEFGCRRVLQLVLPFADADSVMLLEPPIRT
jgi:hypothetical protein